MEQRYDNVFAMFVTVKDFMGAHTADTTGVSAIPTLLTSLGSLITQIDAANTAQATPLTGIATDKEVVRTALEEAVFLVSSSLSALASAANNNTLLDEVDISRTGLDKLSAEDLDVYATRVAARGATNQSALTGTYGITLTQVTTITTARTAFAPWIEKPRTAVAERSGQTASIPGLVRQGQTLLRAQLDRIMVRYRLTNPSFYAAYLTARVVVDRHGAGGTTAALEITSAVKSAATEATLTYANAGGAGAVTILLQWKLPGEASFGHDIPVARPVQILNDPAWAGQTVEFRTKAVNGAGLERLSAVKPVSF